MIQTKVSQLLVVDTTTEYLSVAVTRGEKIIAKVHRKLPMMHSTKLVPAIATILKKARVKLADLDGFCVSIGPGSFTGLRIGVTTVKGLAYATGKPIVTVPTLDAIAHNAIKHKGIICPILDARKGKVYACIYRSGGSKLKRLSKHLLLPLPELVEKLTGFDDILILGDIVDKNFTGGARSSPRSGAWDGAIQLRTLLTVGCKPHASTEDDRATCRQRRLPVKFSISKWHPRAEIVARYGMEQFEKGRFVKAEALEPMYLYSRECDITGK